jgi:AraC-like DNA-binding protein
MPKIDRKDPARLLSQQVAQGRYFFLRLAPRASSRLELILGGFEHCNPDYFVTRSRYPYFSIEYIVSGQGHALVNRQRHALAPGTLFAYGPRFPHELRTDAGDPLVKYFISFSGPRALARLRRCRLAPGQFRRLSPQSEIGGIFDQLLREGQRSGPGRFAICATLFEFLLLKIEDAASFTAHPSERAREAFLRCRQYIDSEAENLRTLGEIARAVGAEASTLCRWFRRFEGLSPYQYLLRRRMNLAAAKLVEQGGLIKEVALEFGFSDPFHFSRQFRAVHGIAPSALRRHQRPSLKKSAAR